MVEDIPLNQLLMKTLLDDFGFAREIAGNGRLAIEKLKEAEYDIILMDLQMPVMDGLTATAIIRNQLGLVALPIIAMTANAFAEDKALCLTAGMNDFIVKPVEPNDLKLLLLRYLAG